ncbi:MAG: NHLP bacteriocin export ABC transporter permease/ATPase subunit [Cyanobacteria bacterium P01_F01_bin.150]
MLAEDRPIPSNSPNAPSPNSQRPNSQRPNAPFPNAHPSITAEGDTPSLRTLKSNEPLFLDNPNVLWSIESGAIAIFSMSTAGAVLNGRRRYLFNLKPGDIMFPTTLSDRPTSIDAPCQLVAIALEPATLQSLTPAQFITQNTVQPSSAFSIASTVAHLPKMRKSKLQTWLTHLGSTLANAGSPPLPTPIRRYGILGPGECFQLGQGHCVMARLLHGQAHLAGLSALTITPASGWLLLSSHLWVSAHTMVELELAPLEVDLAALQQSQILVLQGIQQLEQVEQSLEYQRFQAREQLNSEAVNETLYGLAGVFEPSAATDSADAPFPNDRSEAIASPLLAAVGAVGHTLGIPISAPPESEDLGRVREPLEAIARASHIRIRQVSLRGDWWQQDSGPLLAYTQEGHHPIALLPVNDTHYDYYDPTGDARGRCTPQIAARLSPSAYTFYRPLPVTLKPWTLSQFAVRGHVKELIIVMMAGITTTLLGMVAPQATGILIDEAIPSGDRRLLIELALGLLVTALGTALFQLTQSIALMRLETLADSVTQAAVWDRLLKLKASFFREYAIGDLSSRVSAISQIRQKLGNTILKSLFSSIFSFLNLGLLFYYSPILALIAVGVAILNIAVTIVSGVMNLKKVRPLLERQGALFGMVVQLINGVSKFRVAGAEPRAYAYWGRQYRQQLRLSLSSQGIEDSLAIINKLLAAITPAVLFGAATLVIAQSDGDFSTGTFLAFNAAFGTFIGGATSLSTTVLDVLDVVPIWQRAQPILNATPEVDETRADPGRLTGHLSVNRATFRYRPEGAMTLNEVCIEAEPGEFIALVGPSGSGKSTLFRLLLGFETPESGTVAFDGQDLAGLDMGSVRRQLGVVLQNSRLMSASIFENISSNALISMDEAWEAARMAGFADDVEAMPMGMHTVVSEGGTNLSGGQRQRLLIARALALRPRILLFDEATSALDNRTQAIVSESLDQLKITRVVVAHRLSTIRNADRIYVLEQGQVVEAGSYDQLAANNGLFSQLIKRQQA